MSYKNADGLMRHLRSSGIAISGSKQKRQLMNSGYFHGYKGYRFYKKRNNRLPFVSFEEVYATIQLDSKLKSLFYSKIMFIETAVKNHAIECLLRIDKSESIQAMCDKAVCGYDTMGLANEEKAKNNRKNWSFKKLFKTICLEGTRAAIRR